MPSLGARTRRLIAVHPAPSYGIADGEREASGTMQYVKGIYKLTQIPALYTLFQNALMSDAARKAMVDEYLKPSHGARVLDIGCGSAAILPLLGAVDYVGIDANEGHIAAARERHGEAGRFIAGGAEASESLPDAWFDIVYCVGVLHHLDNEAVRTLADVASRKLRAGGRLVAIDPAFVAGQHPVAAFLARRDSGRCVRDPDGYSSLLDQFSNVTTQVRHDLLRVPYTHCITTAQK